MKKILLSFTMLAFVAILLVGCGTKKTTTTEQTTTEQTTTEQTTTEQTTTEQTTTEQTTTEQTTTEQTTTEAPVTYSTTIKIHYLGVLQTRVYNWTIEGDADKKTFEQMGAMTLDTNTGYTAFIRNLGENTFKEFGFILINAIEGETWIKDVDQDYKVDLTNPTEGVTEVWYNMGDGTAYTSLDAAKAADSYADAYARALADYKAVQLDKLSEEALKHYNPTYSVEEVNNATSVADVATAAGALLTTIKNAPYYPEYIYDLAKNTTVSVIGVITGSYGSNQNICIEYNGYSIDLFFAKTDEYNASGLKDLAVGTVVIAKGSIDIFNNLYEIKGVTAENVTVVSDSDYTFNKQVVSNLSGIDAANMSNLYTFDELTITDYATTNSVYTFTDALDNTITGFKFPELGTLEVGDIVTFDAYVTVYNDTVQLRLADGATITYSTSGKVLRDQKALVIANEEALYYVDQQLTLPATGANGSAITWASSNTELLGNDGKVVSLPVNDTEVKLTATIAIGDVKLTKEFTVTIRHAMNDQDRVESIDLAALLTDAKININGIYTNVTLPTAGEYSTTIEWTASDNGALTVAGVVARPAAGSADVNVKLTAKITLNDAETTKEITVVVLAMEEGLEAAKANAVEEVNAEYATQITATKKYLVLDTTSISSATLIADVTAAKEAIIASFADAPYKPEAAYGMTDGTKDVSFVGFYTGKVDNYNYIVEFDGTGIDLNGNNLLKDYTVGDAIKVTGTIATYNGLLEITNCTVEKITLSGSVTPAELTSVDNLAPYLSRVVILKGVTLTSFNKSGNSVLTSADGKTVNWYKANIDLPLYVQVGDTVTLRVIVSVYNTTYQVRTDLINSTIFIFTDADKVAKDKAALTIENENALTEVGQQITLPSVGTHFESAITWSSDNEVVLDNTGKVVALPATETVVTLTATITLNEVTVTKAFEVTVKPSMTDQDKVNDVDVVGLFGNGFDFTKIKSNITLPTTDPNYGTTITWSSNNTAVIANDGTVTRPALGSAAVVVKLTYTITLNEATTTASIDFTVLPIPTTEAVNLEYDFYIAGGSKNTNISKQEGAQFTAWSFSGPTVYLFGGIKFEGANHAMTLNSGIITNPYGSITVSVKAGGNGGTQAFVIVGLDADGNEVERGTFTAPSISSEANGKVLEYQNVTLTNASGNIASVKVLMETKTKNTALYGVKIAYNKEV